MKKPQGFSVIPVLAIIMALVVLTMIGWATVVQFTKPKPAANTTANVSKVACTADAKQCPDGSYVGRVPPSCEFAECPMIDASARTDIALSSDYEDGVSGTSFQFPSGWTVARKVLSGGSFPLVEDEQGLVFEPNENTLDFPAAARCTVQDFSAQGKSLSDWVTQSEIYDSPGTAEPVSLLNILTRKDLLINDVSGLNITEGGPNAQQTRSFYFMTKDGLKIIRFGYYLGGDVAPRADFEVFSRTCGGILGSIHFINGTTAATKDWKTYTNGYYGFTVGFPTGTEYCLNDFCQNDVSDKSIQRFAVRYPTTKYLEIEMWKNETGMTAIAFAQRSVKANEQYSANLKDAYTMKKTSSFAGESAYEFVATGGFEERGKIEDFVDGLPVAKNDPDLTKRNVSGRTFSEPHQIIYFDHNGTMYRVLYAVNDQVAEKIIDSFTFEK